MIEKIIEKNTFSSLEEFLDHLVTDPVYQGFLNSLQSDPEGRFYRRDYFHGVKDSLKNYPYALKALNAYGFDNWDKSIAFTPGNLKAVYLIDEDFINDGRAFVLFNLVGSTWTYVATANNQVESWEAL